MGLFGHGKPTEKQLEWIVMHVSGAAKLKEQEDGQLTSMPFILELIDVTSDRHRVKLTKSQRDIAQMSVNALLVEGTFVNELLEHRHNNPGKPLPADFGKKMFNAIYKFTDEFEQSLS